MRCPERVAAGNRFAKLMCFDIVFIHDIYSVAVAQFIKMRTVWIVTCPYRVDIILFAEKYIGFGEFFWYCVSVQGVELMAVDAFYFIMKEDTASTRLDALTVV